MVYFIYCIKCLLVWTSHLACPQYI